MYVKIALFCLAALGQPPRLSAQAPAPAPLVALDHVTLEINRLEAGTEEFARLTGVVPVKGGPHEHRPSENALARLGSGAYLEILAPLPSAAGTRPSPFTRLTPTTWSLASPDLDALIARLQSAGFETAEPVEGSRRLPDGSVLRWRTVHLRGAGLELAPYFIQWAPDMPHPSATSPAGCRLAEFELAEPNPARLQRLFDAIGYRATLRAGEHHVRMTLECPKGRVTFGS